MGIASQMKTLTESIAAAHVERAEQLAGIAVETNRVKEETNSLMRDVSASRRRTGAELRQALTKSTARRSSAVAGLRRGFRTSRSEANARTRRTLASDGAERRNTVRGLTAKARESVAGFRSSRLEAADEMERRLNESRGDIRTEVGRLLGQTEELMTRLRESRRLGGDKLREGLAADRRGRGARVAELQNDLRAAREVFRSELEEAARAWHGVAHGGNGASAAGIVTGNGARETSDLEGRLMALISAHPQGLTLIEASAAMGIAHVVLGRAARTLLEKRSIRKENKTYFPGGGF